MKPKSILLAAGVGVAVLIGWVVASGGSEKSGPRPPRVPQGLRVVLFGDSHVGGLRKPLRDELERLRPDIEFFSDTKNGTRIPYWVDALSSIQNGDVYLICLGSNDAMMGEAGMQSEFEDLSTLVRTLFDGGAVVYWVDPPALKKGNLQGFLAMLARNPEMAYVEHFESWKTIEPGPDGVHATEDGYRQWAEQLAKWLA